MSSEPLAVSVRHIGKTYSLGLSGRRTPLREIVANRVRHPLARRRRRESFDALDDVSFDVHRGDVVGIIGQNGAGKSTMLKLLSRIIYPDRGEIDIHGRVGSLLEVGTGFHPELTGRENVYLNGAVLGMKRREIDSRFDEIVAFADIGNFLDTPVKRYSSGMGVRLAFAVAAHLDPEILIVDEVLSVGDANFQRKCLAKMEEVATEDHRTVLYVSHNLVSVEYLCPRTVWLDHGRIAFDGTTTEAIALYLAQTTPDTAEQTSPGVFDLTRVERPENVDGGILRSLELSDPAGRRTSSIPMQGSLRATVGVHGLNEHPDAVVVFKVRSELDRNLFVLSTGMKAIEGAVADRPADEELIIDLPRLPITAGAYTIEIVIRRPIDGHMLDGIRVAGEFTVAATDAWGSGYQVQHFDGAILVDWTWRVEPAKAITGPAVTERVS